MDIRAALDKVNERDRALDVYLTQRAALQRVRDFLDDEIETLDMKISEARETIRGVHADAFAELLDQSTAKKEAKA